MTEYITVSPIQLARVRLNLPDSVSDMAIQQHLRGYGSRKLLEFSSMIGKIADVEFSEIEWLDAPTYHWIETVVILAFSGWTSVWKDEGDDEVEIMREEMQPVFIVKSTDGPRLVGLVQLRSIRTA